MQKTLDHTLVVLILKQQLVATRSHVLDQRLRLEIGIQNWYHAAPKGRKVMTIKDLRLVTHMNIFPMYKTNYLLHLLPLVTVSNIRSDLHVHHRHYCIFHQLPCYIIILAWMIKVWLSQLTFLVILSMIKLNAVGTSDRIVWTRGTFCDKAAWMTDIGDPSNGVCPVSITKNMMPNE